MPKRPSFQFYPSDWLRDTSLRSCSIEARGLWIDMLCYMHEGQPYGHLKVNLKVILPVNLSSMTGLTLPVCERLLQELKEAGVFGVDGAGCMFSRRMIRDEETRSKRAAGGHYGGNPALIKGKKKVNLKDNLTTEDEYVEEDESKKENKEGVQGEKYLIPQMWEVWKSIKPRYPADKKKDFEPLKKIAVFICGQERIVWVPTEPTEIAQILTIWRTMGEYIELDKFFKKYSLEQVERHIQSISQSFQENKPKTYKDIKNESDDYIDEMFKKSEFNGR